MKKFFLLTLLFCSAPLHAVVILVHGTYAVDEDWCRPGGKFYETLRREAARQCEYLVPFAWSGQLSGEARVQGAEALYELLMSYPVDEEITLIGHSHGGNVINLASQMLQDPTKVKLSLGQRILDKLFRTLPAEIRKATFLGIGTKIKAAYYLGTPVMDKPYLPNMDVIDRLYSCYSKGDRVQTGLGVLYGRKVSGHERITNCGVTISGRHPSHSDLHHYKVAQWLLSIPDDMQDCRVNLEKGGKVTYGDKK